MKSHIPSKSFRFVSLITKHTFLCTVEATIAFIHINDMGSMLNCMMKISKALICPFPSHDNNLQWYIAARREMISKYLQQERLFKKN